MFQYTENDCVNTIISLWRGWWSPRNHHRFTVLFAGVAAFAGVWVLPDEYRNLRNEFRKNVSGFSATTGSTAKHSVLRQSTAFGRILHIFHTKVDMDLEVGSRPALLHVLVLSVLQTTSEITIHARPLTVMDQKTSVVAQQGPSIGNRPNSMIH